MTSDTMLRSRLRLARGYSSDLHDEEWRLIAPLLQPSPGPGRPRTVDLRQIVNAMLYMDNTGCQWRLLPSDFPAWQHVSYYFYKWTRDGTWEQVKERLQRNGRVFADARSQQEKQPNTTTSESDAWNEQEQAEEQLEDTHCLLVR
jgi:putative transposase